MELISFFLGNCRPWVGWVILASGHATRLTEQNDFVLDPTPDKMHGHADSVGEAGAACHSHVMSVHEAGAAVSSAQSTVGRISKKTPSF